MVGHRQKIKGHLTNVVSQAVLFYIDTDKKYTTKKLAPNNNISQLIGLVIRNLRKKDAWLFFIMA